MLQVKLQHLVTLHVRSSAFGSKLDAGMFMKALSVQYDVWAENHYQRMLLVGSLSIPCCVHCVLSIVGAGAASEPVGVQLLIWHVLSSWHLAV